MPEEDDNPTGRPPRIMFGQWLADHAGGALNIEATAALADVVEAVSDLGKPGKVIVELTITSAGSGKRTVITAGEVKTKLPRPAAEASVFYVGEGGTLHREDPFQARLPGTNRPDEAPGPARHLDLDSGREVDE